MPIGLTTRNLDTESPLILLSSRTARRAEYSINDTYTPTIYIPLAYL